MEICLQPLGDVPNDVLNFLKVEISRILGLKCVISDLKVRIPRESYNPLRKQYLSTSLLYKLLETNELRDYGKILGITDRDLYVPGLNFVFGEALLNGKAAVISLHRLRPEFYGKKANKKLFFERALKEAIHELGHTFGLGHCKNRRCVMYFSNSIYDTDVKGYDFCPRCRAKLKTY